MTIIITGAAGFIGSNLARRLLAKRSDVILVDDLRTLKDKWENVRSLFPEVSWVDYRDLGMKEMVECWNNPLTTIIHLGADSTTTNWDIGKILTQNTEFTEQLIRNYKYARIIFASSASIYGNMQLEHGSYKAMPLCPYAYSKYLSDKFISRILDKVDIVSLRFFNVYGQCGESHKGAQASVFHKFTKELITEGAVRLFRSPGGKIISRDFVHVDDVLDVIEFFIDNRKISAIMDVGTGKSVTYETVADICCRALTRKHVLKTKPARNYIEIPEHLRHSYQYYTKADLSVLRKAGYTKPFKSIEEGWS